MGFEPSQNSERSPLIFGGKTMTEIILGIDLGTTFSVAAYVDERGVVRVIRNAEGDQTTPSAVLIEGDDIQVGKLALNQAIAKRDQVVRWIKRSMGDLDFRFHGMGPIEISAEILKKIKADCEVELGVPLREAVITCPAYFSAIEIESTMKAGCLAGFDVKEIVKEPTAAAVYYGLNHLKEGDRLLVCDLGGGTYDASILTLEDGAFRPLGSAGDRELGGHDWTMDLLDYVAGDRFKEIFGEDPRIDPSVEQMLYDACEQVKRDFAQYDQAVIPCVYQGQAAQVTVTRSEFERLTEWRITTMLHWTQEVLTGKLDPASTWDDIDYVLLVGGSTRLRRVPEALEQLTGKKPIQTAEVDTIVARGAALLATTHQPGRQVQFPGQRTSTITYGEGRPAGITIVFKRIAERHLGTRVIVPDGNTFAIQNAVIIPYGTDLPADKTRTDFQTTMADQPFFDVPVVEFDNIGADVIHDTWRFRCPPGLPKGTPVHVTFRYDQSQQSDVIAVEQRTHTALDKEPVPYEEPDLDQMVMARAIPRDLVFALDISGSMLSHSKIERAKQAVIQNTQDLINNGGGKVRVGVVAFGSTAVPVCELTSNVRRISDLVSMLTVSGSTAMGEGLDLALEMLSSVRTGAQREIVLVSDGMPDVEETALYAGQRAKNRGITLTLLGIGHEEIDEAFLKKIADRYLVIEVTGPISDAINLLTQATPSALHSGLTWGTSGITVAFPSQDG
jgi:molecular chaperone DnaK